MRKPVFIRRLARVIDILGYAKPYYNSERIYTELFEKYRMSCTATSLDIGSGPTPRNPFGADIVHGADLREDVANSVSYADLSSGALPFDDCSFDFVTAYDVLEHIPRVSYRDGVTEFPFISLMNEIFRVLKKDGVFFSAQPCYPSKSAFQDPTHVNIMTEDTIHLYFCEPAWARIYGYVGTFSLLDDGWCGEKYFSFIKKTTDVPVEDLNFVQR